MMNDRRGHRKLRLTSRKHFKPKTKSSSTQPFDYSISFPLNAYVDGPVKSLESLQSRLKSCGAIPSEWSSKLNNGSLSFYKLDFTASCGPEVMLSLVIHENFSWSLLYRKYRVPKEYCGILKSMPSEVDTVSKARDLLVEISNAKVCEGNADARFLTLPNIHKGTLKDATRTKIVATLDSSRTGSPSLYHVNCEVLIKPGVTRRCEHCKIHRKSLCAMVSRPRTDDQTDPSSHTNYSCLHTPEKDKRMSRIQQEKRKLSIRISQLQERISSVTAKVGITLTDDLHNDVVKIAAANTKRVHSTYSEDSFQRIFWDQQVQASKYKNAKSMKWHPLFIKWCLYLRHLSGKSYEVLRSSAGLKLPSQSTLRDYTHHIPAKLGFSAEVDQNLIDVSFLSNELNKYVILVMDEVHIKHDLVYDKHEGHLIGFVDLGSTNNKLLEYENTLSAGDTEPKLASTMLVFMVRGLLSNLNYPYVQFACDDLTGSQMFDPMWEAVSRLERLGFCVLGLTCDGASPNRRLWKLNSDKDELVYKVPNCFAEDGRDFYFISDPPHLLKTIRNSFCNNKRNLWCNGQEILWKHVVDLYYRDTSLPYKLRQVPKLKYEHVNLTSFSKMRVDLAAQVMSESVAKALESGGDKRTEETVKFIKMIDKFFDALNVANLNTGRKKRKAFQSPYIKNSKKKDFRLKWLTDEFIPYLKKWEDDVKSREGFTPKEKEMMLLARETRQGIEVTVKSFVELVEFIFKIPGAKFFLSERLSQDPLENFFGCQRQRGRTGENPNVQQFCKNTQALRVINSVCGTIAKGNCRGQKRCIDLKDSNPLPKRRRGSRKNKAAGNRSGSHIVLPSVKLDRVDLPVPLVKVDHVELPVPSVKVDNVDLPVPSLNADHVELPVPSVKIDNVDLPVPTVKVDHIHLPVPSIKVNHVLSAQDDATTVFKIPLTNGTVHLDDATEVPPGQQDQDFLISKSENNVLLEQTAKRALRPGKANEVVVRGYGIALRRQDMWTLNSCAWLNDQVINFYMGIIMEKFDDIFVYSTFFYTKLLNDGGAVHSWYKGVDFFSKRLLIFPVHQHAHWCLAVANVAKKQLTFYDSLHGENSNCLQVLGNYLDQLKGGQFSRCEDKSIPTQTNSFDCGVFTCLYARFLAERLLFTFGQKDISFYRKQIIYELLHKDLLKL